MIFVSLDSANGLHAFGFIQKSWWFCLNINISLLIIVDSHLYSIGSIHWMYYFGLSNRMKMQVRLFETLNFGLRFTNTDKVCYFCSFLTNIIVKDLLKTSRTKTTYEGSFWYDTIRVFLIVIFGMSKNIF